MSFLTALIFESTGGKFRYGREIDKKANIQICLKIVTKSKKVATSSVGSRILAIWTSYTFKISSSY
ncbi:MAG TPA: hypothetical protein VGO47_10460, partial [Chlamydiales bacterium]|nr:hypothetical protein [Chlamydiales bacterium]